MDGSVLNMFARFQKSLGAGLAVGLFADITSYRSMHLKSTWIGWHGCEINTRTHHLAVSATETDTSKFDKTWSEIET